MCFNFPQTQASFLFGPDYLFKSFKGESGSQRGPDFHHSRSLKMRIVPRISLVLPTTLFNSVRKPNRLIVSLAIVALSGAAIASASSRTFRSLLLRSLEVAGGDVVAPMPLANSGLAPLGIAAPISGNELNKARRSHSATLVSDGKVLIAGGEDEKGFVTEAEIFDPATQTFALSENLNAPRADHTATRLSDGRVLIAGGRNGIGPLSSTEIFDPTTGGFSIGPDLNYARSGQTASQLNDGRIVFVGGDVAGSVEIYDPRTNTLSAIAAHLISARAFHSAAVFSQTVGDQQIEKILIAGGTALDGTPLKSGEVFDVASLSFSPVSNALTDAHTRALLRVLPDGKVQIIGGTDHEDIEIYDPAANIFGAHAHVYPIGDDHPALVQEILDAPMRAALLHVGATSALLNRERHTITEMPATNQALVAGGIDSSGNNLASASLFKSSPATVTTDKLDYAPGTPVVVTGKGWEPHEFVTLSFHEDPHQDTENLHTFTVQADVHGDFVCQEYAPEGQDAGVHYILAAKGGASGWTAQTAFTDADTAGDYRSAASGNWTSTATWETFNGTSWVPAGATPTNTTAGVITIRSGHTVTISASGLTYDQVVVDAGGQVMVAPTITSTVANGAGTDLVINGTWLNQGGTWTISSGATWSVGAGGTFIHNTSSGIATPLGNATFDAASNFIYRGSSTLTPATSTSGRTYGNLSFESTSGSWPASAAGAGALTINGDFTIGSGVTYSTTQTGVMTFAGSFTNNGTLTNGAGTQVYTFAGNGKSISGASSITFETWNVNAGASITLGRSVAIDSSFTGTVSGTLNCGSNLVSGAGNFILTSGASLGIGHANGITSGIATSGNVQVTGGTRTFDSGANYTYNGSAAQFTGDGLPTTLNGGLAISNSAGVTLNKTALIVNGTLTLGSGSFAVGSKTLELDGPAIAGTPNNLSTTASSNLIFGGSATGISIPGSVLDLSTLSINNANGVALNGPLTIGNTLTLSNGALSIGANTLTLNGNLSVGSGLVASALNGTVNYNRSSDGQFVGAFNYGNLTFSNFNKSLPAGTIGIAGLFMPGSATGHSDFGSTFNFNSPGAQTVPAFQYHNLMISGARGGATVTLGGGIVGIAGTFNPSATSVTYSLSGNTIEYNGTAGSSQTLPSAFLTYNNLTLNNFNGTIGPPGLVVNGLLEIKKGIFTSASSYNNVQIDASGTLTLSGPITVSGSWNNDGTFNPGTNGVIFNGPTGQTISGDSTFYNLTKSVGSPQTLLFGTGSTQKITHSLTLAGTAGNLLSLRSAIDGHQWNLHAPSTQSVSFVNVQDSNASGGNIVRSTNSVDAGNNVNWSFSAGTLSLKNAPYSESETNADHNFTVTVQRTGGVSGAVSVHYATSDGTATTADNDYDSTFGDLNWADGDAADKTFTVTLHGDAKYEDDERLHLTLSSPTGGATIGGTSPATLTITNDDTAPTFAIGDVTQSEGNSGETAFTFTVAKTGSTQLDSIITYSTQDGTATSPNDFASITNGSLMIPAGQSSGTITVQVNGDATYENDESFTVHISDVTNGSAPDPDGLGNITNDDNQPSISIDDVIHQEGDSGATTYTFTVTRTGSTDLNSSVNFTTEDNSATFASNDYASSSGTLVFLPSEVTQQITVIVNGDTTVEPDETFTAHLSNGIGATITDADGTGTIVNDDTDITVAVSTPIDEDGAANLVYTFTREGVTDNSVTVNFNVGGTATLGDDYTQTGAAIFTASSGAITFGAGNCTATVTIDPTADMIDEPDETIILTVASGAGYHVSTPSVATGTITDDDTPPAISINDTSANEGDAGTTPFNFTLSLSNPSSTNVTVDYTTENNTATQPSDYTTNSGTVTFPPGETSAQVTVSVNGDMVHESNETLLVNLANNSANSTTGDSQGVGTIINDDSQPGFSIDDVSHTEGDSGATSYTFTVTRNGATDLTTKVDYATVDGSAAAPSDYTAIPNTTLAFAPGDMSKNVQVFVNGDTAFEPDETFTVHLSNPVNATISDADGTGTIPNDDLQPTITTVQDKTAPYSDIDQPVTLSATVIGSTVNGGTVAFTIKSGTIQIGSSVTSGTVVNGNAVATYTLPGTTAPGDYMIEAAYSGSGSFTVSSGAGTLTVTPADLLSDTATLDADFKKIDGFDVLFNKIDRSTLLRLENTNPGTFHHRLRMTNLTGADLNSNNGATLRAFIEVPAMVDCGGVPCPITVNTTLPAFSLRNKKAVRVRPDDKTDDMPVVFAYKSTGAGSCADLTGYSPSFPADESPRCIMVSGFALPKNHRAEIDMTFESRWKKSLNWDQNASLFFFSGFPFKATMQVNFTTPSATSTGYLTAGLVGAGQRVTALGGFSFNQLAQPTTGLIVRLFNLAADVLPCGTTSATKPVSTDIVNADGFYFIWRKGTDQGPAGTNDLPDGVKYVIQTCNDSSQLGPLRTLANKLGKKEFDEEDFYGVTWP
jgi:hypothetical protein